MKKLQRNALQPYQHTQACNFQLLTLGVLSDCWSRDIIWRKTAEHNSLSVVLGGAICRNHAVSHGVHWGSPYFVWPRITRTKRSSILPVENNVKLRYWTCYVDRPKQFHNTKYSPQQTKSEQFAAILLTGSATGNTPLSFRENAGTTLRADRPHKIRLHP